MARIAACFIFLALMAPAVSSAQVWSSNITNVPVYWVWDSPRLTMADIRPLVLCPGSVQDFARDAEGLIAADVDSRRAEFAPKATPLQSDQELARIAEQRSCDMARKLVPFSHIDARGAFIAGDLVTDRLGPSRAVGENIAETGGSAKMAPGEFAGAAVDGWMKSPEHRANILDPRYDSEGVGVAKVGDTSVATQVFRGTAPPQAAK